jgi:hypothetical protein
MMTLILPRRFAYFCAALALASCGGRVIGGSSGSGGGSGSEGSSGGGTSGEGSSGAGGGSGTGGTSGTSNDGGTSHSDVEVSDAEAAPCVLVDNDEWHCGATTFAQCIPGVKPGDNCANGTGDPDPGCFVCTHETGIVLKCRKRHLTETATYSCSR